MKDKVKRNGSSNKYKEDIGEAYLAHAANHVLLLMLSSSDILGVSSIVFISFDHVTCYNFLCERIALPLEIGVVGVGSGKSSSDIC